MSTAVKKESLEPCSTKFEPLDETSMTPDDYATSTTTELQGSPRSGSPLQLSRRPRNPFILFRTWYIKQGYLKQFTSSGSELSKITGKLWRAMHEDDRKFWAEQSKLEREASQGKIYAPPVPRSRGSRSRKKGSAASSVRYNPVAVDVPDPINERMNEIVQLLIAGKTGEELEDGLRSINAPNTDASLPATGTSHTPSLPLVAPVPRSARASVSLDALEHQSQLSGSGLERGSVANSLSPQTSLYDLPGTPEHFTSGYSTPLEPVQDTRTRSLDHWGSHALPLTETREFSSNTPLPYDQPSCVDAGYWPLDGAPDTYSMLRYPVPAAHKPNAYPQTWGYCNTSAPSYDLNYPAAGYDTPSYASQSLVPSTPGWWVPDPVSAYNVPGHASVPVGYAGDLTWPPEWVNESY